MILALTVLLAAGMSSAFAIPPVTVDSKIISSFKNEFGNINDVKWDVIGNISRANFVFNSSRVEAYFNNDGKLLGTARNILFQELPLNVAKEINKRFDTAPVYGITEITTNDETSYRMTVETAFKKLTITADASGNVYVEKRVKK